ncbi:MAG: D-alanyl-D-alanine endopeptidase [Gammaproteobacteria bacterium]|nr:D-alanyl-D-alanine endopeptidase [Gammaproteobacteria bacterium]
MKHVLAASFLLAITSFSHAQVSPVSGGDAGALELASVHAVIADLDTGATLFEKHPDVAVPIASITKLMTAMVILDAEQPLTEWLTIVDHDTPPENNAYSRLRIGSQATRGDLLRIALMSSENLACHVLATHYPGGKQAFIAAMNDKARELGMTQTRFVDSSGLSPLNRSTASDLARMARAALEYQPIRDYSSTAEYTVSFRSPSYALNYGNTNALTRGDRWNVVLSKTGYLDEAGRCLVMVATVGGRPVTMILLDSFGTRSPLGDAGRIRRWIETGSSGPVAGAARDYEQRRAAAYRGVGSEI